MYNFDMMSFSFHQTPSTQSPTSQQLPSHHSAPTSVSTTHTTAQIHALLSHSLEHEHGQVKQPLHIGRNNRFSIHKVLIESLFGYVCLGVDHHTQQYVCIKVSNKQLCSQNQSVRGDNVVDNVNREAAIMSYLQQKPSCTLPSPSSTASVSESHLPAAKCISRNNSTASGISLCHETDTDEQDESERDGLDLASDLSRLSTSASSMSDCLAAASTSAHSSSHSSSSRSAASPCCTPRQHNIAHKQCVYHHNYQHHTSQHSYLDDGSQYIIKLISEFEDHDLHCLVSEYASGSDLFDVILKHGPLDNELAKHLFRQICTSVKYMHDRNIAHLDISLENVCLTADGEARIIDLGSACIHPLDTNGQYLQQYGYSIQPAQLQHHADPSVPLNDLKVFPCIPARRRPGKKAYMSPELYSFNSSSSSGWLGSANKYFDAYMCDTWSLGVILYTLLSGHPPFTLPHPDDSWFRFIYTSRWLHPESRLKKNSSIYRHIDEDALQLINAILKPQHQRLTVDQILQSPWLNQSSKYSSNKRAASQSDSMPSKHHPQPQHQYAQHHAMSQ